MSLFNVDCAGHEARMSAFATVTSTHLVLCDAILSFSHFLNH